MSTLVHPVETPQQITSAAQRLRERVQERQLTPLEVITVLERWGAALKGPGLEGLAGLPFLRLWLRGGTLEPIVSRELGPGAGGGGWRHEHGARLRAFALGVVGHWPAANIEIQPMLSLSCSLLGGNAALVRIPARLRQASAAMLEKLHEIDRASVLVERVFMATFDHDRLDLQRAMAAAVDGAMIWGGEAAVTDLRALPFPSWARVAVFGPRLSVAAMDGGCWSDEDQREAWCRRLARDVWQFDQQACSSPQTLFLERRSGCDVAAFVAALAAALQAENGAHPRRDTDPALTSAICLARASWLLESGAHRALFPATPDWTLLIGEAADIPRTTHGRTLSVMLVDDLSEPIARFGRMVQTLGLAVQDAARESALAEAAARQGVDRIVRLGHMHVFGSPWDGSDMIRPTVRMVRHVPSQAGSRAQMLEP